MAVRVEKTAVELMVDVPLVTESSNGKNGHNQDAPLLLEVDVSPEVIRLLRRDTIHRRIHAANYGMRWFKGLEQYTPKDTLVKLASSSNADHGDQHTSQLRATSQDFWYNVGVIGVEENTFYGDAHLVLPFFHAVEFHDQEQALFHKKHGHGEAGAIYYALKWKKFRDDLRTPGTTMNDSLINLEHNALTALVLLYNDLPDGPDSNYLFSLVKEDRLNEILNNLDKNHFLEDKDRKEVFVLLDHLCEAVNTGIINLPQGENNEIFEHYMGDNHIRDYVQLLENYFMTDEQIIAGATMIMNHASPERVVSDKSEEGVHQFTIHKALSWMKREMHLAQLSDLFEIYPQLRPFKQELTYFDGSQREEFVKDLLPKLKLTKFEKLIIEALSRTDEDVINAVLADFPNLEEFREQLISAKKNEKDWTDAIRFNEQSWQGVESWTINGGIISVWRTLKTSSKMFKEAFGVAGRPLFVWHKNSKGHREGRNETDYRNRSALKDENGNPRTRFECDLDRWLAEFRLPLRQLCDNEWFLNLVGQAYQIRIQSIRLFSNAVAWKARDDYASLENELNSYRLNDIKVLGYKNKNKVVNAYGGVWRELLEIISNKKANLTEPIEVGGVVFPPNTAIARFKAMLRYAEEEIEDSYPPVPEAVLKAKGYQTEDTPLVFILPEDY